MALWSKSFKILQSLRKIYDDYHDYQKPRKPEHEIQEKARPLVMQLIKYLSSLSKQMKDYPLPSELASILEGPYFMTICRHN